MIIEERLSGYDWEITPKTFRSYDTLYRFVEGLKDSKVSDSRGKDISVEKPYLFIYYFTGGYSGGNCWNDDRPTYSTTSFEAPQLHKIFLELTGLQLQELEFETHEFTNPQYYGNSEDYQVLMFELDKIKNLYRKLNLPSIL